MNDANIDFYRRIGADKLRQIAALQGLESAPEIPLLMPYLENSSLVVEIGAGYGRIVKALRDNGYQGKIIAQERCPELSQVLRESCQDKAEIFEADIKRELYPRKPDVFLWMWSGILEFTPQEQQEVLIQLYKHLQPNGILVVEIPREIRYVGKPVDERKIVVEADWGRLEAYLPSEEELIDYARKAGFAHKETIHYQTTTGLKRSMYIFGKSFCPEQEKGHKSENVVA
ncbi:MAG: class I SAM-dependent methyltransferase [Cytophagales bacterium]|nr:class I SAM-dependent methyltransferase [Bernardetiaceae bacterium]MDW8211663.1 class I SAM-dependent methyltransferase [Cytophagales bacterium]